VVFSKLVAVAEITRGGNSRFGVGSKEVKLKVATRANKTNLTAVGKALNNFI